MLKQFGRKSQCNTAFGLLLLSILCTGCNSALVKPDDSTSATQQEADLIQSRFVAIDLVNAIVQVPELHPAGMGTVKVKAPVTEFGKQLYQVMKMAGFTLRINDSRSIADTLSYSLTTGPAGTTYQIIIAEFKFRRAYSTVENRVEPRTGLFVYGTNPNGIKTNDDMFRKQREFLSL